MSAIAGLRGGYRKVGSDTAVGFSRDAFIIVLYSMGCEKE